MISVQDRIVVDAGDLSRLRSLLCERYLSGAEARGLALLSTEISPPVLTENAPVTLWLRWRVADVGSWWAMRAQSGTPEVAAFWAEVDGFCLERERCYLRDPDLLTVKCAPERSDVAFATRGFRETAQLALREGLSAQDVAAFAGALQLAAESLPHIEAASLGRNYAPEYAAGHFTLDLLYPDADAAQRAAVGEMDRRDRAGAGHPLRGGSCGDAGHTRRGTAGSGVGRRCEAHGIFPIAARGRQRHRGSLRA
ncbi:MAG: hypothetical protein R3E54_13435 [Halioglobus sp.]